MSSLPVTPVRTPVPSTCAPSRPVPREEKGRRWEGVSRVTAPSLHPSTSVFMQVSKFLHSPLLDRSRESLPRPRPGPVGTDPRDRGTRRHPRDPPGDRTLARTPSSPSRPASGRGPTSGSDPTKGVKTTPSRPPGPCQPQWWSEGPGVGGS